MIIDMYFCIIGREKCHHININMNKKYSLLTDAIEKYTSKKFKTNHDFEWLAKEIEEVTHEHLSTSTLMRIWGYRKGVKAHKSTLDILARYIGYNDSELFFQNSEISAEEADSKKVTSGLKKKFPVRWALLILFFVIAAALAVCLVIFKSQTPRRILQLNELQNTKQYRIATRHSARGKLGVYDNMLATTFELAKEQRCLEQSTFAILQYEGDYYLYSVADKRFINVWGHEADAPIAVNGVKLSLTPRDSCFVFSFAALGHTYTLNVNSDNGVIITDYGIETEDYDDGNMLEIYEDGNIDPTEPLQRISQFKAEAARAQKALKAEKEYCVYTLANADGSEGRTRRYLSASGRLTDTLTDSCRFTLHTITGDTLYASPSFRLCLHDARLPVPQGCKTGFNIPKYGSKKSISATSHIEISKYYSDPFNGQVFLYGSNGRYAIRSTCAPTSRYFAHAYWSVDKGDKSTDMVVGYSTERKYIWHIEPL